MDPVVHADTERVAIDRAALRSSGELQVDVHAVRRRTLAGLVALAVLTLVGALAYRSWLWAPQVLLDLAVVGYVMVVRAAVVRERRATARRQSRVAARPPVQRTAARPAQRPAAQRPAAPAAPVQAPAVARVPHPSLPLAPVHPIRPARVVAARTPVAAGWSHGAVVDLDDEELGFADIDVYRPRTATG